MGFLQLANSWMIVFPIIVLLYYFFRKKYTKQVVSSTLFWEEAMQETKASPYLQKLQKNLLLLLQLAALILFVLALMQPYIKQTELKGQQFIFVLDTSATMLAGNEKSLFEAHKEAMREIVEQADGTPMTLLTTGSQPDIVLRDETSSRAVLAAIEKLEVTYEAAYMEQVIPVVQSLIGTTSTSVYVWTDALEKTKLPIETEQVEWHVFGQTKELHNVALTKFAAMQQNDSVTALVQLMNETDEEQTVELHVSDQIGKRYKETLKLPPNELTSHVMKDLQLVDQLTAMIMIDDDYDADNVWKTTLQKPSMAVLLDPEMHALVQKGFASVYEQVLFYDAATLAEADERALVVTNDVERLNNKQSVLLIGRNDVESEEALQFADSSSHALFNFSPLENVYVQSLYPPFEGFETIATVGDKPFIQLSERGDIVVLADMQATDWPLHPSFPLFLWSTVQQLSSQSAFIGTFSPKQSASIVVPAKEWSIYNADGQLVDTFTNSKQFIAPAMPGFYEMKASDEKRQFSVVVDPAERTLMTGENFTLGNIQGEGTEVEGQQSFMLLLALLILMIVLIEWEVQRRRGFTN